MSREENKCSVAVGIVEAIAAGDVPPDDNLADFRSRHLHEFVRFDGRVCCFLRELARYIDNAEKEARKDRL